MVLILSRAQLQHQVLSSRTDDDSDNSDWDPMQITAPIIVGVSLIIIFAACIMWYRWSHHFKHHFRRVRDASVSKVYQVFMPQYRRRVQHTSIPVTLDESMATPCHIRRYHHSTYIRSDSTDSETPLRDSFEFSFPPHKYRPDSFRKSAHQQSQRSGRRLWRWWSLFGVGPREVKPTVPSHRWVVEGPDENSTVGHGDGSFNSQSVDTRSRWTSGLPPVHEQTSDDEGDPGREIYGGVIQIGDPDSSTHSATPITPGYHQGVAASVPPGSVSTSARTAAPEYSAAGGPYSSSNSRTMTTAPTTYIQQSSYTPGLTHSNSPAPPMYSSVSHSRNASIESLVYPADPDPTALYPWSVRAMTRTLPRIYQHERQMSTESILANSAPMVPQSMY
ncbi:uncharacterized protein EDB93DRAFT_1132578 [Suillus bovinus]|uniref:uncharacterized protein n=1 Tax=Suillus bovinus TaxID=48563 RepID=UPI001B864275|nr:uncharacterized protein EDB93DRAFT_1132578 [Suillus bovinus]KAG2154477.1 hypothetical protein EDB93DRAFT_1132578 [Suillus bovinus]